MTEIPDDLRPYLAPGDAERLSALGKDPVAVARFRKERQAAPDFRAHARRRILPPPWKVVHLGEDGGAYTDGQLRVITSAARELDGQHWLHVSLSRADRIPSYADLVRVKQVFVGETRKAIMVLPPKAEHVNMHPYVLHLFCPLERDPLPDFTGGLGVL